MSLYSGQLLWTEEGVQELFPKRHPTFWLLAGSSLL